jgi:RNA polymerase sigma factor (sigma-70 family)
MQGRRECELTDPKHHHDESIDFDRRWRPALRSFFSRRLGRVDEVEDLTQETLLRALNGERTAEAADGYIFQIAQNLLIDRARRAKVRNLHAQSLLADKLRDHDPLHPARILEGRSRVETLLAILQTLPERTQTIFILYRIENMSQDAIAQTFGISVSAVKQQVAKAMGILGRAMQETS